jgi:hypothetical protein
VQTKVRSQASKSNDALPERPTVVPAFLLADAGSIGHGSIALTFSFYPFPFTFAQATA